MDIEAVQIQNLKEVLNAKNAVNMRTVKTASKTMGKKRGSSKPYNDGKDSEVAYSLPEHAA